MTADLSFRPSDEERGEEEKSHRNFLLILASFIIIFITSFTVYFSFLKQQSAPTITNDVACTEEAKICPDGTAVSRTGPNCEFSECPEDSISSQNMETYVNEEYAFKFEYPTDVHLNISEGLIQIGRTVADGGEKTVSIHIFMEGANQQLEQYIDQRIENVVLQEQITLESPKTPVYLNGYPAYSYTIRTNAASPQFSTKITILQTPLDIHKFITIADPIQTPSNDQILSTFKFLDEK